ncbi:hypothetical protein LCGC14_0779370 [marine sediment metagenome]|uniref:NADH-ubiquinone oxidoreductase 51kDa subunit iron-sulphur binding domain-containing protein n=1 Tax=marine sediment metagenome TaxID=412755 RepID=A0A0F9T349_9ZZZZ
MNILKALFGSPQYVSRTDTTADSPDPDPNDIWALTDPDARDNYEEQGELSTLEHDIRYEVMRGGPWQPKELEYKREIRRLLLEGIIITSFCVGIHAAFIYIRGEYEAIALRLEQAISEAYENGFLGKNILESGFDLDIFVHRGAGAYICGEETALLESLEGKRGVPRLKPPFPASVGLWQCPTVINNVETISNISHIILNGAEWFVKQGLPKDGGTRIFGVSGMVKNPGIYELPLGTSLKDIIFKHAGGMKEGKKLKAVIPGGMSAPILTADEINIKMDFDSLVEANSMLGSAAIIVIDEKTSILDVLKVVTKFYSHESCGQCTPCRIGNSWINKIVKRIAEGKGKKEDIDSILRLASNIEGNTLCPLGDAAAMPILSITKKFRKELESHV